MYQIVVAEEQVDVVKEQVVVVEEQVVWEQVGLEVVVVVFGGSSELGS